MILSSFKVLRQHGRQYIRRLDRVVLHESFRGRPVLTSQGLTEQGMESLEALCPVGAIASDPVFSLDMGRCIFCGECAFRAPDHIRFTNNYRIASPTREGLVVRADEEHDAEKWFDAGQVRPEIPRLFRRSLRLREVSAGGDNSCEMELNAAGNVNFDMGRYGMEFTASPRHADGVVITGPVTRNLARALEITLQAVPCPRVIIAVGSDAISGGLFAGSPAIDRSFFQRHQVDLYVPGNPAHPMAFISGVRAMLDKGKF